LKAFGGPTRFLPQENVGNLSVQLFGESVVSRTVNSRNDTFVNRSFPLFPSSFSIFAIPIYSDLFRISDFGFGISGYNPITLITASLLGSTRIGSKPAV